MSACAGLVRPPSVLIVNTVTNAIRRRPFPAASSYLSPCSDTAHRKKNAQTDLDCTSSLAAPTHRTNRMLLPRFLPRRRQPPTAALHPPAPPNPFSHTDTHTRKDNAFPFFFFFIALADVMALSGSGRACSLHCSAAASCAAHHHTHTKKHTHHHTHTRKTKQRLCPALVVRGRVDGWGSIASSHH